MLYCIIVSVIFIFYFLIRPEVKKYSREKRESREHKEYLKSETERIEKYKREIQIELENRSIRRMSEKEFPKSRIKKQ